MVHNTQPVILTAYLVAGNYYVITFFTISVYHLFPGFYFELSVRESFSKRVPQ